MPSIIDDTIARHIVAEFDTFRDTFGRYIDRMNVLVGLLDENTEVAARARYLVYGSDHVKWFLISGNHVVSDIDAMLKEREA
ncbi:hypothetical protein V3589_28645 [Sinorhizobium fredii]|uniref:hypothetical protein n=1 Tax=Rhizobium fredii TaxID=380 RepID=UPI003094CE8B